MTPPAEPRRRGRKILRAMISVRDAHGWREEPIDETEPELEPAEVFAIVRQKKAVKVTRKKPAKRPPTKAKKAAKKPAKKVLRKRVIAKKMVKVKPRKARVARKTVARGKKRRPSAKAARRKK